MIGPDPKQLAAQNARLQQKLALAQKQVSKLAKEKEKLGSN